MPAMSTTFRTVCRSALAALALACASAAWAAVGADQAAAVAARMTGGRVLSVEKAGAAWRVKLVTAKGEVRVVLIDAASGRPL
ncbi:MAG: peptidase [Ramlibacter sp.]